MGLRHWYRMRTNHHYRRFIGHKNGDPITMRMESGYYINTTLIPDTMTVIASGRFSDEQAEEMMARAKRELYETVKEFKMQSGRVMLATLRDFRCHSDPSDMVKESWWNIIGYKGFKPVSECTWEEYQEIYVNLGGQPL